MPPWNGTNIGIPAGTKSVEILTRRFRDLKLGVASFPQQGRSTMMLLERSLGVTTPTLDLADSECRVFERTACERSTSCRPVSLLTMKEKGWAATIRDISRGGVRLHAQRRFERGTPLAIELPSSEDASTVFVKVVFVKSVEGGGWMMGCQFVSELSEDELQRVLTPLEPKMVVAARSTVTILSNVGLQIQINDGSRIRCRIKRFDASNCWPLAPGKIVRVSGHGRDQKKWSLRLELTECVEEAQVWTLQTRLLQSPVMTDLLQALGS